MRFKYFSALLLLLFSVEAFAAGTCRIEIKAPQWKDSTVFLCNYFAGNLYKKDSIQLSSQGTGVFQSKELLPEGLYVVYRTRSQFFDLLLADDQEFQIAIDTTDFVRKNVITNSKQSEAFQEYARYLSDKQKQRLELSEKMRTLTLPEDKKEKIIQQLLAIDFEVKQFMASFIQRHQNEWVGQFFKGVQQVEAPFSSPKTVEEHEQKMSFLKAHFFDNINLTDARFWRTNYFPQKVDAYMEYIVESYPDSLALAASRLVARTKADTLCYRLMLTRLFNNAAQSKIMGMENVWAKLAEDYYFKGHAPWVDSTLYVNVEAEYRKIRYNRIGMQAHDLQLTDIEGRPVALSKSVSNDAVFILLYFFEPSCGHCKEMTPLIHEKLYPKYKSSGLEVVAVYTQTDKEEWQSFIDKNQMTDWVNLWDPQRKSFYWSYFDVSSTPGVYLLDRDLKIIAKKLDEEGLETLMENLTK